MLQAANGNVASGWVNGTGRQAPCVPAQVTNPPIDPLREGLVMSLEMRLGKRGNLLTAGPDSYAQVRSQVSAPESQLTDPVAGVLGRPLRSKFYWARQLVDSVKQAGCFSGCGGSTPEVWG